MSISRPIFLKPVLWKPTQVDYSSQYFSTRDQRQQIDSEAGLLTRTFKRSIWIFCIDKVETYLLKKIYYEIMDIYISTRKWQGLKDYQVLVQENI